MFANFKAWLAAPFSVNMSAMGWFFLIGMLLVFVALWQLILRHILME